MAKDETKKERFSRKILEEMLKLSTAGFGLVAALAWNSVIQEFVKQYVQPFFGSSSGVISMLIYAVIVTVFAVAITYQLTKLKDKI